MRKHEGAAQSVDYAGEIKNILTPPKRRDDAVARPGGQGILLTLKNRQSSTHKDGCGQNGAEHYRRGSGSTRERAEARLRQDRGRKGEV